MSFIADPISAAHWEQTRAMLRELRFPVHRNGYTQLCIAVPIFAEKPLQSLTKELYPRVADCLNCSDGRAVEHCIRDCILYAWDHRESEIWDDYFPNYQKAPSNKQFLSTLAQRLE